VLAGLLAGPFSGLAGMKRARCDDPIHELKTAERASLAAMGLRCGESIALRTRVRVAAAISASLEARRCVGKHGRASDTAPRL